jgi:DNA anti-recombination protein RmuC
MRNEEIQQQIQNVEKALRELRCSVDRVTDRNVDGVKKHLYQASVELGLAANDAAHLGRRE